MQMDVNVTKVQSLSADEAVPRQVSYKLHVQAMSLLATAEQNLHRNGYLKAVTRGLNNHASKTETFNT